MDGARITCWAGGGERAEFLRQNALLANIWTGLSATTAAPRSRTSIITTLSTASPTSDTPRTRVLLSE